ncbi:MAG: hypothetical protein H6618_02920 [Deltaproteobacteria bacterium]|nr:hypothetical protein [Deltaproteobacteria bacterium]
MTDKKEKTAGPPCPRHTEEKLFQLQQVEIYLRNLPGKTSWKSEHLSKLTGEGSTQEYPGLSEATSEMLFRQIVLELNAEGISPANIAHMINQRLSPEGTAYCDEDEVRQALN